MAAETPTNRHVRVVVVDDSAFMRRAITQMLQHDPNIEVAATGRNGVEAVDLANRLKPDVMTLDIEMPEMDGLTALRHIVRQTKTRVIMLSSLTTQGSIESLRALKIGAADVLAKDSSMVSSTIMNLEQDLISRVHALGAARPVERSVAAGAGVAGVLVNSSGEEIPRDAPPIFRPGQFDVVCIGSSTGGPPVVETIMSKLPENFDAPVIVAQHMPELFTRSMAQRLNEVCPLHVEHVENSLPLRRGCAYIARGGMHVHLRRDRLAQWSVHASREPDGHSFRPSVDVLYSSAAEACGRRVLAIILTGIGDDGLEGARVLHEKGAPILAQREDTCVVYGMPKAVTRAGLATARLTPLDMVASLRSIAKSQAA